MVGLALMDGLFQAMPEKGRIIILGDEYQLPSVDAGDLLAEICREEDLLHDAVIRLKHSYRFGEDSGIGQLTEAIRVGDAGRALQILESDDYPEVTRRDLPEKVEDILEPVIPFLKEYLESKTPEAALEKLKQGSRKATRTPQSQEATEVEKGPSPSEEGAGFNVGRNGNKRAIRPKNLMLDTATIEALDDLCYRLKKKLGRRVSASEIIRAAFRTFQGLSENQQLRTLEE